MQPVSDEDLKRTVDQVKQGITGPDFKKMISECQYNLKVFEKALNIDSENDFFLETFMAEGYTFSRYYSEVILDTFSLYQYGVEVFESDKKFINWLECNVRALSDNRPIDLIDSFAGREWIMRILGRIKHGVFS